MKNEPIKPYTPPTFNLRSTQELREGANSNSKLPKDDFLHQCDVLSDKSKTVFLNKESEKTEQEKSPSQIESSQNIILNQNQTLTILDDMQCGEVLMPEKKPQKFTRDEIEDFYLSLKELTDAQIANIENLDEILTNDGLRLYEIIKTKYLEPVPKCPVGSPTIYNTIGLPGSGKSTIVKKKIMAGNPEFVLIDPDEIKTDILKDILKINSNLKGEIVNNPQWAGVIQRISTRLSLRLLQDALLSGKDIILDSMSIRMPDFYRKMVSTARQKGYLFAGIVSNVSTENSIKRVNKRANIPLQIELENGEHLTVAGRRPGEKYVNSCAQDIEKNLPEALKEALFDFCVVFDNNKEGEPPRVIASYVKSKDDAGNDVMFKYAK